MTILDTYPQLIGYDPDVYEYFQEQSVHPLLIEIFCPHEDVTDLTCVVLILT